MAPRGTIGLPAELKSEWAERYRSIRYDELPWFSPTPYPWVTQAVRERWWIRGSRILDIGCGAGTNSLFLARAGFRVSGIDVAEGAIEAARERAKKAGLEIDFRVADALRLPYRAAEFGGAIDIGCFHTLPIDLRRRYAQEVGRVIHARRTLALSWIAREHRRAFGPPHRPSVAEVAESLESEFLFQHVEYRPSSSGRQFAGAMPVYCARLGRRSFRQPPAR